MVETGRARSSWTVWIGFALGASGWGARCVTRRWRLAGIPVWPRSFAREDILLLAGGTLLWAALALLFLVLLRRRWGTPTLTRTLARVSGASWPFALLWLSWLQDPWFLRDLRVLLTDGAFGLAAVALGQALLTHTPEPAPSTNRQPLGQRLARFRYPLLGLLILLVGGGWILGWFGPRRHPVGDEPSYLMITHSLFEDHDVIMDDDYDAQVYRRFYYGRYPEFTHVGFDGRNYPHHSLGLPLLLVPLYAIVQRSSDVVLVRGTRFGMLAIYLALALATLRLIEQLGARRSAAWWAAAAGFLAGPLLFFSAEIYPETLDALLMVLAVGLLARQRPLTGKHWLSLGAMFAAVPWLGIKYLASGMMLGLVALLRWFRRERNARNIAALALLPLLSFAIYFTYLYVVYRNLNPGVIYTGVHPGTGEQILRPGTPTFMEYLPQRLVNLFVFWWGFLLEQRIGLLFLMPVLIFIVPGLITLVRQSRWAATALLAPVAGHLWIYAWHNNWGGFCPPNRQAIPILPLLLVPLALGLQQAVDHRRRSIAWLAGLVSWRFAWGLLHHDRWLYTAMNPHLSGGGAKWLYAWSPLDSKILPELFPLIMGPVKRTIPNILWSAAFLLLVVAVSRAPRNRSAPFSPLRLLRNLHRFYVLLIPLGALVALLVPPRAETWKDLPGIQARIYSPADEIIGREGDGFWLEGKAAGRLLLLAPQPIPQLETRAHSLVQNTLRLRSNQRQIRIDLPPDAQRSRTIPLGPWRPWLGQSLTTLQIQVETGASPYVLYGSKDNRFLGAYITLAPAP
jgi:hypothetical protein